MTARPQPDPFAHPKIAGGSNPLRAGWDNCALEIVPLPLADKANMVDETLPLRLAGGVRLRREYFGGIAQVGPLGYLLSPRAYEVLEHLIRPFSPKVLLENPGTPSTDNLQRFLSSCRAANLIEIAPDESIAHSRLYAARSEESRHHLQSPLAVEI